MSVGMEVKPYSYFDTPDGHDLVKKLWYVTKPAVWSSIMVGTTDIMLFSHPKTYTDTLLRYGASALPILGTTAVFVLTTNTLCNIRKKDDEFNWIGGGLASGGIIGSCFRNGRVGILSGIFLGVVAMVYKQHRMQGIDLFEGETVQEWAGVKLQPDRGIWPDKYVYNYKKWDDK